MIVMLQLVGVLVFLAISGINSEVPQNDENVNNYPWMASITTHGKHVCSGVIIDEYHIITSDRCVPSMKHTWNIMNNIGAVVGRNSLKVDGFHIFVRETFSQNHYINPTKNPTTTGLGILKVAMPIPFGDTIQPIELSSTKVPPGAKLQMVGWKVQDNEGKEATDLKAVTLKTINHQECQPLHEKNLTDNEFCTVPESSTGDNCKGDSGNAVIYEGKLVGLTTFGISCANPQIPDVHTSISEMHEYINKVLAV
ncbi:PREDICTED: trypsin-like [Dinoponera quadriceps]|uniref:Trypsin-like n=1 Tax=Dinoponera quadriceps TaxID=609295 RepID=A0A6P3XE29_DINQU|nr:PREDICTED: trypsin-like [Dinoponera quadriceps]